MLSFLRTCCTSLASDSIHFQAALYCASDGCHICCSDLASTVAVPHVVRLVILLDAGGCSHHHGTSREVLLQITILEWPRHQPKDPAKGHLNFCWHWCHFRFRLRCRCR